ncbi:MAG: glycosyltransferase family 4 protein [Candidatus Lernaella stagnicola]|nr:glycosyltransferase family 4 protein [Candidatus Lernaella stagnicola]
MRVAMLGLKGLPGTFGGVERHVERLGAELVKRGHEVVAYVRPFYTPEPIVCDGVQTRLLPTIHSKHLDATVHTFLGAWHAGLSNFDIVHFHGMGPAAFAPIARLLGRRVVVTLHSLDFRRDKWGRFAKWALRQSEAVAVAAGHRVICVSAAIAARHRLDKVVHIPNGVGAAMALPPRLIREKWNLQGGDYVLFAGRVSPEKGVHHLVKAYRNVPGDLRLVIAGGTSHTDRYVEDLEKAKDARTLLVGYQDGDTLAELFSNAAAFVLPSDHEGMPVALLEAWSYGLPALASDIEACREVGGEPGELCWYFAPGDTAALAAQLTDLLAAVDRREMAERARRHVLDRYGWDAIAERVEEQYRLAGAG